MMSAAYQNKWVPMKTYIMAKYLSEENLNYEMKITKLKYRLNLTEGGSIKLYE